jgi:hypothetical protein
MHALCRAAFATGSPAHIVQALDLGVGAFNGFTHRSASGDVAGIYWKMSTDLSRPLISALGMHDALDGFITFQEIRHAASKIPPGGPAPNLDSAIDTLSNLCRNRDWVTDDPLGIGGLLFDICRLSQLGDGDADQELLGNLTAASQEGLRAFLASRGLARPAAQRLAFRELGLAIGLAGVSDIDGAHGASDQYRSLAERIVNDWLPLAHSPDELWQAHQDINDVMLATALTPRTFISIDG